MMKKRNWLFPLAALLIYVTLMAALLLKRETLPSDQQLPVALGLFAFSLTLTEVFIALRLKKIERKVGLPRMYSIHGFMAIILMLAVIAHVGNELTIPNNFTVKSAAGPTGFMAMALLMSVTLTGMLFLSNMFTRKSRTLKHLKNTVFKREPGLWIHRLSVLAVLAIYIHMMTIEFVRSNFVLSLLAGLYVVLTVGGYICSKVTKMFLPRYVLRHYIQYTPGVVELELEPQNNKLMVYQPGQYVFIRFIESDLPKESHPFSISSAPVTGSTSLKVIIKNSGDYTSLINRLKIGNVALLEGPYGSFMDGITAVATTPLVMLAGGIGITPILSILRSQIEKHTVRRIVLIWGLAFQSDQMLFDELSEIKHKNPEFSYYITFSKEHVDSYDFGQITQSYLQRIGINELYSTADFFICGPAPMMDSMEGILRNNHVVPDKIHIEKFSF
ncbi:MAG: hypothetical protein K0S76_1516 [Herbinix sp.]|jgi:predicted ferric reductase|nr:hypothetical protein [Herbinix sp.]MDF2870037.1 hypothetical protein [Anaerocolumna sp.]